MGKVEYIVQKAGGNTYPLHMEAGEHREIVILQENEGKADFDINLGCGAELDLTVVSLACSCNGAETSETSENESNATAEARNIVNNFMVNLDSQDAVCNLNGVYLVDSNNRLTNRVDMNHNVGHCVSNQLFRGILWDSSRSDFEGRIYVAPDAQKTEAYQANNNIVESSEARAHTQPHLEIYADDVKCSHGATVGNKENGELFYMQSRGISLANAKVLLKQAFLLGVLEKISDDSLKEAMSSRILSHLR